VSGERPRRRCSPTRPGISVLWGCVDGHAERARAGTAFGGVVVRETDSPAPLSANLLLIARCAATGGHLSGHLPVSAENATLHEQEQLENKAHLRVSHPGTVRAHARLMTAQRIDSLESFDIDGTTQWVLLRGNLRSRRVLLIVQQGPGLPLIHEARAVERRLHLEAGGVVAYWDQRGTGKSWRADPSTINLAQLVADVRAMVDALCARLGVDHLDILGLSIGATLATLAAAQNPARIGHIVAVGIDVDWAESERYAYAFACDQAAQRGDLRAQRQLLAIGPPPHDTSKRFLTRVRWATAYGGIHRSRGFFGLLWENVRRLLASPHYSLREAGRALQAIQTTQERMLAPVNHFDLRKMVSRIEVPIVFFQGRHDVATPPELVARYVEALDAPRGKSLVWFDASAHMPQCSSGASAGR
jgi:proline iminopeptidase